MTKNRRGELTEQVVPARTAGPLPLTRTGFLTGRHLLPYAGEQLVQTCHPFIPKVSHPHKALGNAAPFSRNNNSGSGTGKSEWNRGSGEAKAKFKL